MYDSIAENKQKNNSTKNKKVKEVKLENIPQSLKNKKIWVLWRYETGPDGKNIKIPLQPYGARAATSRSSTWSTYHAVEKEYRRQKPVGNVAGIGIVLSRELGIVGIDIDHCFNNDTYTKEASEILSSIKTYAEISPSGEGIRMLAYGDMPIDSRKKNGDYEMYITGRYMTITGDVIPQHDDIASAQDGIDWYTETYLGSAEKSNKKTETKEKQLEEKPINYYLDAARYENSKIDDLYHGHWQRLGYASQSDADAAYISLVSQYTGPDYELLDAAMRVSGLMRDKWDSPRADSTYGADTIAKFAVKKTQSVGLDDNVASVCTPIGTASHSTSTVSPLTTYALGERINTTRPKWLVDKMIRKNSTCVLFGESGSRKTFVAIDLALSIATGTPFLDYRKVVKQRVFYIISEGADDFEFRCEAWRRARGCSMPTSREFVYYPGQIDFSDNDSAINLCRSLIAQRLSSADVIFIDTLAKNFSGDSDKNADMSRFVSQIEKLRSSTEATVIIIHHTGWGNTDRERGGRSLRDGVDASICVSKNGMTSTLSCKKQKIGEEFDDLTVDFQKIRLPEYDTDDELVEMLVATGCETGQVTLTETVIEHCQNILIEPMNQSQLVAQIRNRWIGDAPSVKRVTAELDAIASSGSVLILETGTKNARIYSLI